MKILITASRGTIGSRVAQRLRENTSYEVFEATRQVQRPGQVFLDISNSETVHLALKGIQKVVLITPASPTEMEDGIRFVRLAKQAQVKQIVFMSIHQVEKAPHVPHFAAKIAIQKELESPGLLWTTVAPNNFYQNDLFFKSSLLENAIYPQPFGNIGLSRVDADDIAEALANALVREELARQIYPLIGPQTLTARDVCQIYSQYLNQEIRYGGDDLEKWAEHNKPFLPGWLLSDWLQMYAFFQAQGLKATASDYIQQEKILGRPAKAFEIFVKETVQQWKS